MIKNDKIYSSGMRVSNDNKFALEDADYQALRLNVEKGRPSSDFALSIDFAKKLSIS